MEKIITIAFEKLILFEDDDILVVSKPPGLVVTRTETIKDLTLQDMLAAYLQPKKWVKDWVSRVPVGFDETFGTPESVFAIREGIVHRLDKNTSGVLLVAKNPGSLVALLQQFKQREVQKKYVCLTHGKFAVPKGSISAPIQRDAEKRQQFTIRPDGRPAQTEYEVQQFWPHLHKDFLLEAMKNREVSIPGTVPKLLKRYQGFSLVTCWPKSGRTHQIRVHMAFIKHPIVGDDTYSGKKRSTLDSAWCPRQFLHAAAIEFQHPATHKKMQFEAPLPADLSEVLLGLSD